MTPGKPVDSFPTLATRMVAKMRQWSRLSHYGPNAR
jgi:hypothetical protein